MKLIVAIVNNDDYQNVQVELSANGFGATKLSTSGGFLRAGNVTLLVGVEDERVDEAIAVISEFSSKRTQMVSPAPSYFGEGYLSTPVEVAAGGATIFVLDVEKFLKI